MRLTQKPSADHIREVTTKDTIILHYTAGGSLQGAEAELRRPDTINVHYILDRDGRAYQYIEDKFWAYHTGANSWNKRSIGIEIVNWGSLALVNGVYLPWTRVSHQAVKPESVCHCKPFRGYSDYEDLTQDQKDSLPQLIAHICNRHDIIHIKTHAEVNGQKADFPPDHSIYAIIDSYLDEGRDFYDPRSMAITEGKERIYTTTDLQARINYLVGLGVWKNEELNRLIQYRNRLKEN